MSVGLARFATYHAPGCVGVQVADLKRGEQVGGDGFDMVSGQKHGFFLYFHGVELIGVQYG